LWGDMVDIITCAIFGDCRLRGVGVVRGVGLPSTIDLTRRPYNTCHTTVWQCGVWLVCVQSANYDTSCLRPPFASNLEKMSELKKMKW